MGTTPFKSSKTAAASSSGSSQDGGQAGSEDIDDMRARSAELAWGSSSGAAEQKDGGAGGKADSAIGDVSLDELQAELARRRAAKKDA